MAKDPVCGMEVPETAAALQVSRRETTYYFCSEPCRTKFVQSPEQVCPGGDKKSVTLKR